jgi:hypothetical protein
MVHDKPAQFARILAALHSRSDHFLVHASLSASDADRARIREIVSRHDNVELLPSLKTTWGDWSLVEAHKRGIRAALRRQGWDYMINLSGSCYPIKPREAIRGFLAEGRPDAGPGAARWPNYVTLQPLAQCPEHVAMRFRRHWFPAWGRMRMLPVLPRTPPKGVDFHWKGPNWAALHRDFCVWLDSDPLVGRIDRFLKHAKIPDEFWLPWTLMSSPFRETRRPHCHFIRWTNGDPHPHALRSPDFAALAGSRKLFARKVDMDADPELLDMIDRHIASRS